MSARRLVLASTSPYRRLLIERLGIPFEADAPDCDEDALKRPGLSPRELALMLARAKAQSLSSKHAGAYILGSDQLVDLDGKVLGKPHTIEGAIAQLRSMRGRCHQLITAMALVTPSGAIEEHLDVHTLAMRDLSDESLARYVERERPLDCAGSYKIESGGIALFERIEGADFSAITGLPLMALTGMLRKHGFVVP